MNPISNFLSTNGIVKMTNKVSDIQIYESTFAGMLAVGVITIDPLYQIGDTVDLGSLSMLG